VVQIEDAHTSCNYHFLISTIICDQLFFFQKNSLQVSMLLIFFSENGPGAAAPGFDSHNNILKIVLLHRKSENKKLPKEFPGHVYHFNSGTTFSAY